MWRLWILALGGFSLGTDLFVIAGIMPGLVRDIGVSTGQGGWLVSVFAFTYALASPLLAVATGSLDRRKVLVASLSVFCAANVISATASAYDSLLASRVFAALGAALYMPTASALGVGLVPESKRGRALSIVTGGLTMAIVLGVPLGTWIAEYAGWRATFWFIALVCFVALLGVWLWIPRVESAKPIGFGARMALLRRPEVVAALFLTVLWTAGGFTVYPYLASILTQFTHLVPSEIAWVLFLFGIASVGGNFIGGFSTDRWGATATIAVALTLLAATLATLTWSAGHLITLVLSVALWGIAGWMLTPPQQHRLIGFAPQIPGAILGLNGSAIYLGMGIGTAVGGFVVQRAAVHGFSWASGAFELFALLILFVSNALRKPRPAVTSF